MEPKRKYLFRVCICNLFLSLRIDADITLLVGNIPLGDSNQTESDKTAKLFKWNVKRRRNHPLKKLYQISWTGLTFVRSRQIHLSTHLRLKDVKQFCPHMITYNKLLFPNLELFQILNSVL